MQMVRFGNHSPTNMVHPELNRIAPHQTMQQSDTTASQTGEDRDRSETQIIRNAIKGLTEGVSIDEEIPTESEYSDSQIFEVWGALAIGQLDQQTGGKDHFE